MLLRVAGQALPHTNAEKAITALVNALIPTESFPFNRRERLRELLRDLIQTEFQFDPPINKPLIFGNPWP